MDSLFSILSNREIDEPPEIRIVKQYVREHFKAEAGVQVREREIVVTLRSSALAGALRTRSHVISRLLANETSQHRNANNEAAKRLVFRVGAA